MASQESLARESARRVAVLYSLPDEMQFCASAFEPLRIAETGSVIRIERNSGARRAMSTIAYSVCIGVGIQSAARNTGALLSSCPALRAVIVVGYAGGLASRVIPGSLVVADKVVNADSLQEYRSDPTLVAVAAEIRLEGCVIHQGALTTADRVLGRAEEKHRYARGTNALAVDMESAGAATAATEIGVPWLAVRVITDGVNDDLPLDFNALANPDGSVNRSRIIAETLLHPWKIPALIKLGRRSSLAGRHLAAFLFALLPRISDS